MSLIQEALEKAGKKPVNYAAVQSEEIRKEPERRIFLDSPRPVLEKKLTRRQKIMVIAGVALVFAVLFAAAFWSFGSGAAKTHQSKKTFPSFFRDEFRLTGISLIRGEMFAVIGDDVFKTGDIVKPGVSVKAIGEDFVTLSFGKSERKIIL